MLPLSLLNVRFKRLILCLLVVVLAGDLFLANYGYWTKTSWRAYIARERIAERLSKEGKQGRYFVTPRTAEEFKFFPRNKIAPGPYYASLFGLYSIDGSEVMRIRWHERFLSHLKGSPSFDAARKWLEASGVRYIVSSRQIEGLREVEKVELENRTVHLYEMDSAVRVALFGKARWAKTDEEAERLFSSPGLDHRSEVVVLKEGKGMLPGRPVEGKVRIVKEEPRRVVVEVEAEEDCLLYLSDTFFPGWKAYVNGRGERIERANIAFRAVFVPAGSHLVEFVYRPTSFWLGSGLTVLGIILCVVCCRCKTLGFCRWVL